MHIYNFEFWILYFVGHLHIFNRTRAPVSFNSSTASCNINFFGDSSDDDDDADRGDSGDFDYDDDIGDEYDDVSFDSSTACCDISFILEQNTQHAEGLLLQKIILDIF